MHLIGLGNGPQTESTHIWSGQKDSQSFLRWLGIKFPTVSGNKPTQSKHLLGSINAQMNKKKVYCSAQVAVPSNNE